MKLCSTCLSSCFRPPSILENSRDKKPVVSGALGFLNQENLTQDGGRADSEDVQRNSAQNTTYNGERLVFVNPAEIDLFQRPIPIKEAPRQFQSTSLNSEVQIFDQKKYLGLSMWDIPPSNSATPLPYQQINYETSKGSPSSEFVFGVGFMSIRRGSGGVPSSMDGVEISQSPSQIDKSIQNESRYPSPAPSPQATSSGDKAVRYLLV